jgi:hypothetical protein
MHRWKSALITAFIILILCGNALSQAPDTAWTKNYHRGGYDCATSIRQTADDGFIIVGTSQMIDDDYSQIYLVKTDQYGDTMWTKVLGEQVHHEANCVQVDPNGGYVIGGSKLVSSDTLEYAYIIKTDDNGDTVWTYLFGGSWGTYVNYITCTPDSGYIFTGRRYNPGRFMDVFVHKIDVNGDSVWARFYGGDDYDQGNCVEPTAESGFVIVGLTWSFGHGMYDYYMIRINNDGDTLWTRTFGGSSSDKGYCVKQTADGGFILCGDSNSFIEFAILAVKTDSLGEIEWQQVFHTGTQGDHCRSVQQTSDGGYIFGGFSTVQYHSDDYRFIRTDANGDSIWIKAVGDIRSDRAYCVLQTSDGGYILAGETTTDGADGGDYYVVKLNPHPTGIEANEAVPSSFLLSQNYPNPFNALTTIRYDLSAPSRVTIDIYDLIGRRVETLICREQPAGRHQVTWNAENCSSGIYFYKIQAGELATTKKMILLK